MTLKGIDLTNLVAKEGDYTTWTFETLYVTHRVAREDINGLGIYNDGRAIFYVIAEDTIYIIDHEGTLLHTLADQVPANMGSSRSILDKYLLSIDDTTGHIVKVITADGELWSHNLEDDSVLLDAFSDVTRLRISPSGEWIAVDVEGNTHNALIFIYKGS